MHNHAKKYVIYFSVMFNYKNEKNYLFEQTYVNSSTQKFRQHIVKLACYLSYDVKNGLTRLYLYVLI